MANSRLPTSSSNTALESITLATLEGEKLPELFVTDIRSEARSLWREHRKLEMAVTAITTPVSAFLVGFLFHLLSGTAMEWRAVVAGLIAALITVPLTLGVMYCYFLVVEAPRSLYVKTKRELLSTQRFLEDEKAKTAASKLAGRIDCLNISTEWNYALFGGVIEGKMTPVDGCFMMKVNLWNESAAATTVSGFTLEIVFQGVRYKMQRVPAKGYLVTRVVEHSAFLEGKDKTIQEDLLEFPSDVEITNRINQSGWLRFISRELPSEAHENRAEFSKASLEFYALDRMQQPHKIYDGTLDLPSCGPIERNDNEVFFA